MTAQDPKVLSDDRFDKEMEKDFYKQYSKEPLMQHYMIHKDFIKQLINAIAT